MPKLQAAFSGELWLRVNRTKPEQAVGACQSPSEVKEKGIMTRLFAATAALTLLFAVGAQAQERQMQQDACGRDATRLCKAVLNDGDMAVLACLKQNRARLRPACTKILQEKGQF
jgi:hypothetical protein